MSKMKKGKRKKTMNSAKTKRKEMKLYKMTYDF